jgi:hypothetical protein
LQFLDFHRWPQEQLSGLREVGNRGTSMRHAVEYDGFGVAAHVTQLGVILFPSWNKLIMLATVILGDIK